MAEKTQDVYMPLVIGDWLKGTWGMKAEVRGVYLNLLLYHWDKGFIPDSIEELMAIDAEVGKVWVILKSKFEPAGPGKLRNRKNDEVKEFWSKQKKNGSKGGRPKKENPDDNPNSNPKTNPNNNLHNDIDLDIDLEEKLKGALDEIYLDSIRPQWKDRDFDFELNTFRQKVRGSPDHYDNHNIGGIRLAFQSQLRTSRKKYEPNQNGARRTGAQILGGQDYSKGF